MQQTLPGILLDSPRYTLNYHAALPMLVGTAFIFYAIYVLILTRGSRIASVFAPFAASVGLWAICFGFAYASSTSEQALEWFKLAYIGVTSIPSFGVAFACTVVGKARRLRWLIASALLLSASLLLATFFTDTMIDGTYEHYWGYYPRLGFLGGVMVSFLVLASAFVLYQFQAAGRRGRSERARRRSHGLVIAFVIAPLGALDFFPSFGIAMYPLGPITSAIALFWMARVNHRYGFVDITPESAAAEILETMQGAVIVVDADGGIRVVNHAARDMLGQTGPEIIGMNLTTLLDLPEELRVPSAALRPVRDLEMTWVATDGRRSVVSVSASPLRGRLGTLTGVVYVASDITERKQMEAHLHQSEKLTAIGQLAGGIAHDFNNQLTGIMGWADMLASRLAEDPLKQYAQSILVSARRAADLTQQLLAFGRKGRYLSVPVDVHRLLGEVIAILERSIDKRIRITQDLRASNPVTIGDPTQLQNALLNVALNARDAMPQGGRLSFETDSVECGEVSSEDCSGDALSGPCLRITVADTGTGMTEEVKKHLFEPFFTTKGLGQGTGMGLASVYGAVRNHGGAISVTSEAGRGTVVGICLPAAVGAMITDASGSRLPTARTSARILFVDDEPSIRDMAAEMLGDAGYTVTTCSNGSEAVQYYQEHWREIDLVILDMVMPVMNGHDAFVEMHRVNPRILALLSSGHSLDGAAQAILDEGVIAFVGKPFLSAELLEHVSRALGRSHV